MPVSAAVQMAISQRYIALTDSITHGHENAEKAILAAHFSDHAKLKLLDYEYDPLTVVVDKITAQGSALVVRAQYVGVQKRHEHTIDRWIQVGGEWKLVERSKGE